MATKAKDFIPLQHIVDSPDFGRNLEAEVLSDTRDVRLLRALLAVTVTGAQEGRKFKTGRKPGTAGALRLAIAALLKNGPALTNAELWARMKTNPPGGYEFCQTARLGKYIEGPTPKDSMGYRRFMNVAAEERGKLKPG